MSRKGDRVAGGECGGLRPVIGCRPYLLSSLTRTQLRFVFCMACEVGTRVPMAATRVASPRLRVMAKRVDVVATPSAFLNLTLN